MIPTIVRATDDYSRPLLLSHLIRERKGDQDGITQLYGIVGGVLGVGPDCPKRRFRGGHAGLSQPLIARAWRSARKSTKSSTSARYVGESCLSLSIKCSGVAAMMRFLTAAE